jgi:hypothetical protein
MVVKIGYNCDTASLTFERIVEVMKASKADYHLIMIQPQGAFLQLGDIATIRKYLEALPTTKFIVRVYNKLEGNWASYPKASEYQENWANVRAALGDTYTKRLIFDDPVNEPNLAGDNVLEAKKYVDRCLELLEAAKSAGIKLAIGAWSVGTPHENLYKTVYLPLWKKLAEYKMGISYHAYAMAIPEIGELDDAKLILDPATARKSIRLGKWPLSHKGYLIARPYRWIQLWEEFKLGTPENPYPEIYITEAITDNVFNESIAWIKDLWRQKSWGIDAFNRDPRGIQAWEKYLLEAFKEDGLNFGQILQFLTRHARKNIFYHPAFKAVCLFALNAQWGYAYAGHPMNGTHKEAGSNYDRPEFDTFRNVYLAEINSELLSETSPPMPIAFPATDSPLWKDGTLTLNAVRLRSQPDINPTNVVTTLTGTFEAKRHEHEPNEPILADGYTWHAYSFIDNQIIRKVWLAREVVTWVEKPIVIPPPVDPKPDVYEANLYQLTVRGDKAQMETYAKIFDTLADIFRQAVKVET